MVGKKNNLKKKITITRYNHKLSYVFFAPYLDTWYLR